MRLGSLLRRYRAIREVAPWRVRAWSAWMAWQVWRSHPDWEDGPHMASLIIYECEAVQQAVLKRAA